MSNVSVRRSVKTLIEQPPGTGLTLAVVVMVDGDVVAEAYSPTAGPDTPLISWSMAKSVTHAIVGTLVRDGRLDLSAPAAITEWSDDSRARITLDQLLHMTSGLRFAEDYVDAATSDCIEMLFGTGADDVAGYAAARPQDHAPDTVFNYSSGTTNIICRLASAVIGGGEAGFRTYLAGELFEPLSMTSADPRFDPAGTFVGSSFLYATARDFAAFGELYRNDGMVGNRRILPVGWVDHARTPAPVQPAEAPGYGAHWWLWPEYGAFAAQGYEGQRVFVVPEKRATVVRLGKTVADDAPALEPYLRAIIESL